MPQFRISRSTLIDAQPQAVFDTVADFHTWQSWSPWLRIDPEAKVTVSQPSGDVDATYDWDGEVVGAGGMRHRVVDRPSHLSDDLHFIRPFKSQSGVTFDFEPQNGQTKVTWTMAGKLPFFLFFMKKSMESFISMDYDRGLAMLKERIETGAVASRVEDIGVVDVDGVCMAGVSGEGKLGSVSEAMTPCIQQATEAFESQSVSHCDSFMSVYHPSDIANGQVRFTTGWSITAGCSVGKPLEKVTLPAGKALRLRHIGRYENLGNAWSGAYQFARYHKLKVAKSPGWEIYVNDPDDTATEELITDVYVPLR
ncbi:MAG: SRPBCC family protein [Planctomycetota bacterium]